jgi:hypothetical protein
MRLSLCSRMRLLLAVTAIAAMIGGTGVAVAGQSQGAGSAISSKKKHRHGKGGEETRGPRGKRGKRGPRGPRGAQGPAGPSGPGGPPGQGVQFGVALPTNADPRTIFEMSGVRIEGGCSGGAVQLIVRAVSGDHNILEITSFDNLEGGKTRSISVPNADVNIPYDMLAGGNGLHDYNGLLAVRSLAGAVVTAHWFAMGSSYTSQGDCVIGGTVSP